MQFLVPKKIVDLIMPNGCAFFASLSYPLSVPDVGNIPVGQPFFFFAQFTVEEVQRALLSLDLTKSADPDGLEPCLKLVTDFITKPLQCIFYITITNNCIPAIWKVAQKSLKG